MSERGKFMRVRSLSRAQLGVNNDHNTKNFLQAYAYSSGIFASNMAPDDFSSYYKQSFSINKQSFSNNQSRSQDFAKGGRAFLEV